MYNELVSEIKKKSQIRRIGGYLKEITTFTDSSGKIMQQYIQPIMTEFRLRDFLQVIVGATLLAVPVAFTEEVWGLGSSLPLFNVLTLSFLGLLFISFFVYFNFYRFHFKENKLQFLIRVFSIFLYSHIVVALILTIIKKAPWDADLMLALKRVLIISFPATMSAAISDNIK